MLALRYTCVLACARLLEIIGALSALSGRSWKTLWLLLFLVAVSIAANNSGR